MVAPPEQGGGGARNEAHTNERNTMALRRTPWHPPPPLQPLPTTHPRTMSSPVSPSDANTRIGLDRPHHYCHRCYPSASTPTLLAASPTWHRSPIQRMRHRHLPLQPRPLQEDQAAKAVRGRRYPPSDTDAVEATPTRTGAGRRTSLPRSACPVTVGPHSVPPPPPPAQATSKLKRACA